MTDKKQGKTTPPEDAVNPPQTSQPLKTKEELEFDAWCELRGYGFIDKDDPRLPDILDQFLDHKEATIAEQAPAAFEDDQDIDNDSTEGAY